MKLMCVDPKKRMRTQAEVTSDPFFFEVGGDWDKVAQKRLAPPFIPAMPRYSRYNPGYFDHEVSTFAKFAILTKRPSGAPLRCVVVLDH